MVFPNKIRAVRLFIEMGIFTLLFSWLPFLYQIGATIFFSLLVEVIYNRVQIKRIKSRLSDKAIRRITAHSKKQGEF